MTPLPAPNQSDDSDLLELLERARNKDREALDTIVARYYDHVSRAVHLRLQHRFRNSPWNPAVFSTGDIVHGFFLKVLTGPLHLDHPSDATLRSYLVKAVENHIVDAMRYNQASRRDARRERRPPGDESEDPIARMAAQCGTPSRAARGNEEKAIYDEVLASFDERERRLLKLRLELQHQFGDIAKLLDYKSDDVARKAFHALKARLLIRLRERGISGDGGLTCG